MKKLPLFPTLGDTLKKTFKELYGSMGFSFVLSLLWFAAYLPIIFIFISIYFNPTLLSKVQQPGDIFILFFGISLVSSIWNGLVAGPVTTALYGLYENRKSDYPNPRMFFQIFKKCYTRSAGVHFVYSLVVTALLLNFVIIFTQPTTLMLIAGIISLYMLFFLILLQFYFHPLLFLDNSFKKVVKKSFLLTMDNLGLTFWYAAIIGLLPVLTLFIPQIMPVTMLILFFIYGAFIIYIINHGFETIYAKYDE